MDWPHTEETTK